MAQNTSTPATMQSNPPMHGHRIVIMGVSGSGKTSVGKALSKAFSVPFIDGDDYHPQTNIAKMTRGEPLGDDDRTEWLASLAELIRKHRARGQSVFIGCSALKGKYRDRLRCGDPNLLFVFLDGQFDVILARMAHRRHFFSTDLLTSQFETLEMPAAHEAVVHIDINCDSGTVKNRAIAVLQAYFQKGKSKVDPDVKTSHQ